MIPAFNRQWSPVNLLNKIQLVARTHSRKLQWFGGLLMFYTIAGFFLVPWMLEKKLVETMSERLQSNAGLESVYFNPFTFYLEIRQLQVTGPEGSPLLSVQDFHLDFQAVYLFLLRIQFRELSISGLQFHFPEMKTVQTHCQTLHNAGRKLLHLHLILSLQKQQIPEVFFRCVWKPQVWQIWTCI